MDQVDDSIDALRLVISNERATTALTAIAHVVLARDYADTLYGQMDDEGQWKNASIHRLVDRLLYSVLNFLEDQTDHPNGPDNNEDVRVTVGGDSLMPRKFDPFELRDDM